MFKKSLFVTVFLFSFFLALVFGNQKVEEKKSEPVVSETKEMMYEKMIESLKEREEALEKREQELEIRESKLEDWEKMLKEEWDRLKSDIQKFNKDIEKEKKKRNTLLIIPAQQLQIYNSMKADSMASNIKEIFKKDKKMCLSIISGMDPKKAAKVLNIVANEDPEISAEISRGIGKSNLPQ